MANQLLRAFHLAGLLAVLSQAPGRAKERTMSASEMTDGPQSLLIDFMYLDLTTCDRCLGTERNLEAALEKVRDALATTGARVEIRRTLVETEAQARELAFVSSPTIRINGQDIALET